AALVGLEVRQSHIAKHLDRQHVRDSFPYQREELPGTRMEQQRLVVRDQILIEIETVLPAERHGRVDSKDAVRDFIDAGAGLGVRDHWRSSISLKGSVASERSAGTRGE